MEAGTGLKWAKKGGPVIVTDPPAVPDLATGPQLIAGGLSLPPIK
ncbi:hypothetical protein AZSI13_31250 [Azospira sp. I13]|nr:hypothetical protein AZSI13_31250 [Azospira sp. I13]